MPVTIERDVKRDQVWFRGFFMGPSGSGKSRASLEIASRMFDGELGITLINTEPNRGKLYADRFKIAGLVEITDDYHPHRFIEAIDAGEQITPGGVVIIDSATHEWYGKNGVTQLANRFNDWAKARPLHQEFVDRIAVAQCHVIVCCRAKMKYEVADVVDNGRTKQVITMLGVGPMQDGDFQYEFSLAASFEQKTHEAELSGHIDSLVGTTTQMVDEHADAVAEAITGWCSAGEPVAPIEAADRGQVAELVGLLIREGIPEAKIEQGFVLARRENRGQLHPDWVARKTAEASERARKAAEAAGKVNTPVDPPEGLTGADSASQGPAGQEEPAATVAG